MRALLLLLTLVCGISSAYAEEKVKTASDPEKQAENKNGNTGQLPPVVVNIRSEPSPSVKPQESKRGDKPSEDEVLAWKAALWSAIAAGLAALAAIIQAIVNKQQARIAREALDVSAKNAEAALISADAAVKAPMPILFPLVAEGTSLVPTDDAITHRPVFKLFFFNHGQTPAIVVETHTAILFLDIDEKLPATPPWEHVTIDRDRVFLRGNTGTTGEKVIIQMYTTEFHRDIGAAEIIGVKNVTERPAKRFYIYGKVIYDDVFGFRHERGFCRKVFPRNGPKTDFPEQKVRGNENFDYYKRADIREAPPKKPKAEWNWRKWPWSD